MSTPRFPSYLALALMSLAFASTPSAAQVGRGCSVFSPCSNGYSCQPFVQKCYNSPRREGQPCSAGFSCGAGLRCAAGVQKCVKVDAAPVGVIEQGVSAVSGTAQSAVASMSCPDMQMKCPTGEDFARGTSYDLGRMMCRPSNTMSSVLEAKCPRPYAGDARTTAGGTPLSTAWNNAATQSAACSAKQGWLDLRREYSELFNDACVVHDLCYRAAKQQASCDADFIVNMQAVCYKLDVLMPATAGLSVGACLAAANGGYVAVRARGKSSYDGNQVEFLYPAGGGPALAAPSTPEPRPAATNVAVSKRTAQSSTAFDGVSSRAVDGNTDGTWQIGSVTHTGLEQGAWWMVDLGAEHSIESVTVFNRADCCAERLRAFVAVTATEGWPSGSMRFTQALDVGQPVATISPNAPVYGRYVYVVLYGSDYLSLAEVRVMGSPR